MVNRARPADIVLAEDEIPILDLGPFLAGQPGALDALARHLYFASTQIGFYYIRNHGVPQALVDRMFVESARFHALPIEEKRKLAIDRHKIGYFEVETTITRHSPLAEGARPNLYAAFCMRKDLPPDDPDVVAGKLFRGLNRWPDGLPGFRENLCAYNAALERLVRSMLPIFCRALDVPPDFFDAAFSKPLTNMQLNYYPKQERFDGTQYGIAPHTDRGFITTLCQAKVPGLEVRTADGRWVTAPVLPGHFLINTGDLLRFWTNDLFLSTPHRVINVSGGDRHSIPYFTNPDPDTIIAPVPSCVTPERPAKYATVRHGEFYEWFVRQNYAAVVEAMEQGKPAAPAAGA
jgi:isopenicillin N synthase-like dioxygenase